MPGPLDGATGRVFRDGQQVAEFELRDEREVERLEGGKPGRTRGQVLIQFADFEDDWARQLPRPLTGERGGVREVSVSLSFDADRPDLIDCSINNPWEAGIGQAVTDLWFPLDHPDL